MSHFNPRGRTNAVLMRTRYSGLDTSPITIPLDEEFVKPVKRQTSSNKGPNDHGLTQNASMPTCLHANWWMPHASLIKKMSSMSSSVIIFSIEPPPFGRPYVNMDPEVIGLLREIECLDKLQCPIPRIAEEFWLKASILKENYEQLKLMCNEYVRITKLVPPNLTLLISPTVQRLNRALQPGIVLHNWSSVSLKSYIQEVSQELSRLERILDQANQILEHRISAVLKRIAQCQLLSLPDDPNSPLEMIELVRQTRQQTRKAAEEIDALSSSALCAAVEYVNGLLVDYDAFIQRNNLGPRIAEELRLKRSYIEGTKDPANKGR
ncbi:unnamed protein product [Echinostoma caproni]|uniref:DHC_N1 domain-containing protein n=1 Tax=Echinostoma caproni TaxID=27848 RepID=A0A183AWK3_9TREM|nr:unnamed protein product [Echinostoma caproni]